MGIITTTAKSSRAKQSNSSPSATTDNHRSGGMGFLLVFFPDDKQTAHSSSSPAGSPISDCNKQTSHRYDYSLSSSSPNSSADSPGNAKPMKRTNSSNPILTKTQSTISVCAFLLLFSFLLFALSTFEPPIPPHPVPAAVPRRFLSQKPPSNHHHREGGGLNYWLNAIVHGGGGISGRRKEAEDDYYSSAFALQGMGRLYRRGTRSMADLLVGHVAEDTNEDEFRLFLRLFHRSALAARADVVFLFPSSSESRSGFESVIREENDSFSALLRQHCARNRSESESPARSATSIEAEKSCWSRFEAGRFVKRTNHSSKGMAAAGAGAAMETTLLWGKKIRLNATTINGSSSSPSSTIATTKGNGESSGGGESTTAATRVSYGSVVGFEANELDPENSLSGFLPNPQMALRRWACYPMLLGRVKRNFKHIMLADVKSTLILGPDPLARVRNRAPESLMYFATKHDNNNNHKDAGKRGGGKKSAATRGQAANPAVLMGGGRGIRRFSAAMLTEIVRAAMQHNSKKKNGVTESGILTHLLLGSSGEHILKNIKLTPSPEIIPNSDSSGEPEWGRNYSIIQRGGGNSNNNNENNDDLNSVIMKRICSCDDQDLPVYRECYSISSSSSRREFS